MKIAQLLSLIFLASLSLTGAMQAQDTSPESDYPEKGMVPNQRMLHIGIVVRDIEQALDHWAEFLGLETKPAIVVAAGHEANPTQYRGHPSTAKAKLVFLTLDNLRVELIENYR